MFAVTPLHHLLLVVCVSLSDATLLPSLHWDHRNLMFQKNLEMKVPLHSKLNLVCPNPASVLQQLDSSIPQEQMYENMWIVEKHEYDACKINTSHPSFSNEKKLLNCNNPLQLKYHEMVFRAFIAPGSIAAYQPGRSYYFIGTSDGTSNSLTNHEGGHCRSSNMKMIIYVCNGSSDPQCNKEQISSSSPSVISPASTPVPSPSPIPTSTLSSAPVTILQSSVAPTAAKLSPTNTALALQSSPAVQCQASIPAGLVSMLLNQSNLLYDIYNYTHMIPELRLLIEQKLNQTTGITQKQEQQGNTTAKNCKEQQTESQPKGNELRVVTDAPARKHCKEWLDAGYTDSGSYRLNLGDNVNNRFRVYCDQKSDGGGWTVWMRRFDGFLAFNRDWNSYVEGFGDLSGEFWLGLRSMRKIHADNKFSIRFDLEAPDGSKEYAEYKDCGMENWSSGYKLKVGPFVGGGANDSLSYHNDMQFSTIDRDNDKSNGKDCASLANGGWWFNACQEACLTGDYKNGTHDASGTVGVQWLSWKGADYSLSRVEMKVRPS